jgi:hypothetical protein
MSMYLRYFEVTSHMQLLLPAANELHLIRATAIGLISGGQVKRILFCGALAAVVTACEGSTDPIPGVGGPPGGGAITQAQASGTWTLTLTRTTTLACTGASLPNNQVIFVNLNVLSTGIASGSSSWQLSGSTNFRPLAGAVTLSSGLTNLTLFSSAANTSSGMELIGTLTAAGTVTGDLRDPDPGLTPVFSTSGCQYTVIGNKTS